MQVAKEKSILSYFPKHLTPRKVQEEALKEIERTWRSHEVFVVNLPVATGKSAVATTIAAWAVDSGSAGKIPAVTILVPNNLLLEQYKQEFPYLHTMRKLSYYYCENSHLNLQEKRDQRIPRCSYYLNCSGCSQRRIDEDGLTEEKNLLLNYYTRIALFRVPHWYESVKRSKVLIIDEAHNLIPLLQELGAAKLFHHKLPDSHKYNLNLSTVRELRAWLERVPDEYSTWNEDGTEVIHSLEKFREAAYSPNYIFKAGEEEVRGEMRHALNLIPLWIEQKTLGKFFATTKIILLSATISSKDIEEMGLHSSRVKYIFADSPIEPARRTVMVPPSALNMSWKYQTGNLPRLALLVKEIASRYPEEKGFIHAPYALAEKLRELLEQDERFLFHERTNKMAVYKQFREEESNKILVASGMHEGIDLAGDAGRFQIITKVPYPSLAEAAIAYKASLNPSWYAWETIKAIQQACGRICRGPEDWGDTFILDSSFRRLYAENKEFFPKWFQEGLVL